MSTKELILEALSKLDDGAQESVLRYARSLSSRPRGIAFADLRALVPVMPKEDADEIQRAIEEGCERIDDESW